MFKTDINDIMQMITLDTYLISDTHFNHKGALEFEPSRRKNMIEQKFIHENEEDSDVLNEAHTDWIIYNWNNVVTKDDVVLVLGDLAWKGHREILPKLNGTKILILGNHDKKGPNTYDQFKHVVRGSYKIVDNKTYIADSTDKLFSSIEITLNKRKLLFSHYPATALEYRYKEVDGKIIYQKNINNRINELIKICDHSKILYNIHGHTHSLCYDQDVSGLVFINVSLEAINFKPVKLKDIL